VQGLVFAEKLVESGVFVKTNPRIEIAYRGRRIVCEVTDRGDLDLWLDGALRKRRSISPDGRAYVWTNVELEWEMHHLIEGRFDRDADGLLLYIKGELVERISATPAQQ